MFRDTDAAIAWYCRVFGAEEVRARLIAPDGTCMNAEIRIGDERLMLADEMPSVGSISPEGRDGTSVVLNLHVEDVDAVFQRAVDAGAEVVFPLADQFYGDRSGRIRDPFGHAWILATRQREVPEAEMLAAFQSLFGGESS
jgi:PhnB protein